MNSSGVDEPDIYLLLERAANSAPTPSGLAEGVQRRRQIAVRRRLGAGIATVAVIAAGTTIGLGHVFGAQSSGSPAGSASGYTSIAGPSGSPPARLAPPITAETDGAFGQQMRLDPLPASFVPSVSAKQAYATCIQDGICRDGTGPTVLTIALVTYDFSGTSLVRRASWIAESGDVHCPSTAAGASAAAVPIAQDPGLPRCTPTVIIDAVTGERLMDSGLG
jgi:hypothetical protein